MRVICCLCGEGLNPALTSNSRRVYGWVSPRQSGGANHIKFQTKQKEWAHNTCLEEKYHPATAAQQQLF